MKTPIGATYLFDKNTGNLKTDSSDEREPDPRDVFFRRLVVFVGYGVSHNTFLLELYVRSGNGLDRRTVVGELLLHKQDAESPMLLDGELYVNLCPTCQFAMRDRKSVV